MIEPILTADDREAWDVWTRTTLAHARTQAFRRRVESSRRTLDRALAQVSDPCLSWSGGKDSTVMTHLVCVEHGASPVVVSEKDDLDFPGEEEYVRGLGAEWNLQLRVVHPDVSPAQWIADHAHGMHPGDDIHARTAGLSKACFYGVIERATEGFDCGMLGLRAAESSQRKRLRKAKGRAYRLKSGVLRVLPIVDWAGTDVYAYALSRGIELLPMYRCIGLMHRDEPWRLRKSWWLPGDASRFGQTMWLRRYYPSLFQRMCGWMPMAGLMA